MIGTPRRLERLAVFFGWLRGLLLLLTIATMCLVAEQRFKVVSPVARVIKAHTGLNPHNAPLVASGLVAACLIAEWIRRRLDREARNRSTAYYIKRKDGFISHSDLNIVENAKLPYLKRVSDIVDRDGNSPRLDTVALLNEVIGGAISLGASDIHLSPERDCVRIIFRIDGVLHEVATITPENARYLLNRIKVLARLSIDGHMKPQDGAIAFDRDEYHLRVSIIPTSHGEKVVIRVAINEETRYQLDGLGFDVAVLNQYKSLLGRDHGVIFLTGPTGSGKTTTMYSSMIYINNVRGDTANIVTLEDPIEVDFAQFSQTQVNPAAGLTFGAGLRSVLRQDPDVIMVGEIRDDVTAQAAIRAGMSGHLLLTSVHADSSVGVFNRLKQLNVERLQLASASLAVVNQRLAIRNCPECTAEVDTKPYQLQQLKMLNVDSKGPFYEGLGCSACAGKGKLGRMSLLELLLVTDKFRDLLVGEVPSHRLRQEAIKEGMVPLERQALEKAEEGVLSIDEVIRVLSYDVTKQEPAPKKRKSR